jgi:cytoskeletal protein CcmA (bactofilin family)
MSAFRRIQSRTLNKAVQQQNNIVTYMKPISQGLHPNYVSVSDAFNTSLLVSNGSPNTAIASSKLTFDGTTLNVTGFLDVSGNMHVAGNLDMSGTTREIGNLDIPINAYVTGNVDVSGNTYVTGNLDMSGNTRLTGNFNVPGNTYVTGNLNVSGNARVTGNLDVSGNTRVTGNLDVSGNTRVTGILDVSGNTRVISFLDVSGSIVNTLGIVASTIKSKTLIANGFNGVLIKNTHYMSPTGGGVGIICTLPLAAASVVGDTIVVEYKTDIPTATTHKYGTSGEFFMKDSSCYVPSGGNATYTISSSDGTTTDFLNLKGLTNAGPGIGTYVVFTFNGSQWRAEANCKSSGTGTVAGTSAFETS